MFGTRRGSPAEPAVSQSVGSRSSPPALTYSTVSKYGSRGSTVTDLSCPAARPAGSGSAHSHADGRSTGNRTLRHSADRSDPYSHTRERVVGQVGFGTRIFHGPSAYCGDWRVGATQEPGED